MPSYTNLSPNAKLIPFTVVLIFYVFYSLSHFLAAGRDDTFLMLWAGQSLGLTPWFANYNYEPQEIASSILGVFIAAPTRWLSTEHALLFIKLTGLLAGMATLGLLWYRRNILFKEYEERYWLALGSVVSTAISPSFQYWSLGGLETPYHTFLLLLFCLLLAASISNTSQTQAKIDWRLTAICILLVLVRTEAFWPIFLAGTFLLFAKRCFLVSASGMRAVFVALVFFVGLLWLRNLMTGAIWPNPVYAKVGGLADAIPRGFNYLLDYYQSSPWNWLQALAFIYGIGAVIRFCIFLYKRDAPNQLLVMEAVIGATVFCHQAFVILVGGNWMEYFRFVTAIIPLLNVLVFCMLGYLGNMLALKASRSVMLRLLAILLSVTQIGTEADFNVRNCAKPIDEQILSTGFDGISHYVIFGNCANKRDWESIKPFLDEKLPDLLRASGGHLNIISNQAGFFPYFLRKRFSPDQVIFIDSAGLADLAIARMPSHKTSAGNAEGWRIDLALNGKFGAYSEYLASIKPEVVYLLRANQEMRDNFATLNYEIVWDKPGAIVFFRRQQDLGSNQ